MFKAVSRALARKQNGEKGFTLIELLVVVVIIGILAAIAIPIFLNQRQGAWRSSVESDVKNEATAAETLAQQYNGSFTGITQGAADADGNVSLSKGTDTQKVSVSPDNTLTFTVATDGNSYTITGKNKNLGDPVYTYTSATGKGKWATPTAP